ncbi:MAG: HEAT repeat domain-containing protein, partial [Verrucomicrobiales bacterium]|nr:HEAT repeat domain-containing protein [Verrucomicrobiales bacterium]
MRLPTWIAVVFAACSFPFALSASEDLRAGAAVVDVSPKKLPAIRNGGFIQALWERVEDPLFARALVMQSGGETIALCVVDSCMLPTDVCNAIKAGVTQQVGIPSNRILISATHTHSAPGTMSMCLGTRKDETYTEQMIPQVVRAIVEAHGKRRPAKVGWAQVDAPEFTNCRRWIRRSDKMAVDPFGEKTVRAMMHPGYQNPEFTGPAGPIDPQLSLLSFVDAKDGEPICVLANYSMHYFGSGAGFSADYFGELARGLEKAVGGAGTVGIVSQGTSGDLHWMDYSLPKREGFSREQYAEGITQVAATLWKTIQHRAETDVAMAETKLELGRRTPSEARLAWADPINAQRGDAVPKSKEEVYAEQAEWIHANPRTELVLQSLRIGDLAINAIPNEVYGITGLKLKAQSPFAATFNIELANGAEGYIPPPEQHRLGGYTTWPARTAGLEETAEPKIVEGLLRLLEDLKGTRRLPITAQNDTPYRRSVLKDKPVAFWPLDDLAGDQPASLMEKTRGRLEDGIALGLPGVVHEGGAISAAPRPHAAISGDRVNRSVHFAGGRLRATTPKLGERYSTEFWFWNAFPTDARPVTGYLFSRGVDGDARALGEHLGIGGSAKDTAAGKLFFYTGNGVGKVVRGKTQLAQRDWHHVALVRDGERLTVYLDGVVEIEADDLAWTLPEKADEVFFGGRSDRFAGFEGKMDEIAVYASALSAEQVAAHFKAADRVVPAPIAARPDSEPLSPAQALKALHLPEGYEAQLVATEPLVLDPVAFDWDTRARLWVVEMADYPLGLGEDGASGGRVRVLEDRDGDGVYNQSTLFADGLNFPNGILTWRDGVIVTAAPDILFLRDTDGDGKMDQKEVLFTGLSEGNQQLRANGLRWGMDGWVYVAAGGHHGKYGTDTKLHSTRTGQDTVIGSRDFRIHPDSGEIEPESGPTQFGRNRDDWGHWFGTQNSHPLWHYVLPEHYLGRNPHLAAPDGRVQLPGGSNPPVYPASTPEKRYHNFQQAGRYTSACGGMIYRDSRLFGTHETRAFICEPFHNLVQQLRLTPSGVTFAAERVGKEGEPDFFASEDRWCRPVMVRTGPDGALWIADMYRYMIEHPQWLPPEGKEELLPHYRLGEDKGRLYRIVKKGAPQGSIPKLADLDAAALAQQLGSPNGWVRDKAQQMLLWEKRGAIETPAPRSPVGRATMLWTLHQTGTLKPDQVIQALTDNHPGVRENALQLAESFSDNESVLKAVIALVNDPDPKVRMQLAFSLGAWSQPEAGKTLATLLESTASEPFITTAALSSALPHLDQLANASTDPGPILQLALATHRDEIAAKLIDRSLANSDSNQRWPALAALAEQLTDAPPALRNRLRPAFEQAASIVASASAPEAEKIAAASALIRDASHRDAAKT